jgi:hypothetical protein
MYNRPMQKRFFFVVAAIATVALSACNGGVSPSAVPPATAPASGRLMPGPTLHATPAQPGNSGVFRFRDGSGFFIYDFENGFLSLHGSATLFTDICAGVTPPVFEPVNIQTIASASGLQWMFHDDAHPVQIYPAVPFGCPSLAVTPRLAAGLARITRVDNDLFGDPRAMNAFGWQASGLLNDLVEGGTTRYDEIVRARYNPATGDFTDLQLRVQLH